VGKKARVGHHKKRWYLTRTAHPTIALPWIARRSDWVQPPQNLDVITSSESNRLAVDPDPDDSIKRDLTSLLAYNRPQFKTG
jgi:hypothetical protein